MTTRPAHITDDVPLADYNSWKVGGVAEYFSEPQSLEELKAAVLWAQAKGHPLTVISSGSNVLISDTGINGLVICMKGLRAVDYTETSERIEIEAEAGAPKPELLRIFVKHKLPPALFLVGLPGDVGGGVVMNAGVSEPDKHPREFCEITTWIDVLRCGNGECRIERIPSKDIHWEYRHSSGWQPGIIIKAGFAWPNQPDPELVQKIRLATRKRITTQPLAQPSCGSTFRNPPDGKAGALIEQAGLKGFTIGAAQVSPKHANFIVNLGGAKASEVHQVIEHVRKTVQARTGIELQTEIVYLGKW